MVGGKFGVAGVAGRSKDTIGDDWLGSSAVGPLLGTAVGSVKTPSVIKGKFGVAGVAGKSKETIGCLGGSAVCPRVGTAVGSAKTPSLVGGTSTDIRGWFGVAAVPGRSKDTIGDDWLGSSAVGPMLGTAVGSVKTPSVIRGKFGVAGVAGKSNGNGCLGGSAVCPRVGTAVGSAKTPSLVGGDRTVRTSTVSGSGFAGLPRRSVTGSDLGALSVDGTASVGTGTGSVVGTESVLGTGSVTGRFIRGLGWIGRSVLGDGESELDGGSTIDERASIIDERTSFSLFIEVGGTTVESFGFDGTVVGFFGSDETVVGSFGVDGTVESVKFNRTAGGTIDSDESDGARVCSVEFNGTTGRPAESCVTAGGTTESDGATLESVELFDGTTVESFEFSDGTAGFVGSFGGMTVEPVESDDGGTDVGSDAAGGDVGLESLEVEGSGDVDVVVGESGTALGGEPGESVKTERSWLSMLSTPGSELEVEVEFEVEFEVGVPLGSTEIGSPTSLASASGG